MPLPAVLDPAMDTAKRRQIVDGARKIFLANGFDGASMNDIAREAGVSKGTLYVYFSNKERLFAAIVGEECFSYLETVFDFDPESTDIETVLTRIGTAVATLLTNPNKISAMRAVIGIVEHMPEMGEQFFKRGPCRPRDRLATYLDHCVKTALLDIADTTLAATQFLEMVKGPLVTPLLFNAVKEAPDDKTVKATISSAIRVFLRGYAPVSR